MKKLSYLLIIGQIAFGCNNSDNCDDFTRSSIAPAGILLTLQDANENPLIGTVFVQDSFMLYNPNATVYLKTQGIADPSTLFIWFETINSGEDYYLELDEDDTDTLSLNFTLRDYECYTARSLDQFIYNGQILYNGEEIEPGYYIVTKD